MFRRLSLAVALLLLTPAVAFAGPEVHPALGLTLDVPDGWVVRAEEDAVYVQNPAKMTGLMLLKAEAKTLADAAKWLETGVASLVPNGKVGDTAEKTVAGMKGVSRALTGGTDEMKFAGETLAFQVSDGLIGVAIVLGPEGAFAEDKGALNAMVASLKKKGPAKGE